MNEDTGTPRTINIDARVQSGRVDKAPQAQDNTLTANEQMTTLTTV